MNARVTFTIHPYLKHFDEPVRTKEPNKGQEKPKRIDMHRVPTKNLRTMKK